LTRDKRLASGIQRTVDASTENEESSSSVQPFGVADKNVRKKITAGDRKTASDRSTKRRNTENIEADKDDKDKEPAVKRSKQIKDAQQVTSFQHTTTAKKSMLVAEETVEPEDEYQMETDDEDEDMEEDDKEQQVHRATVSESDAKTTHIRESLMPTYHQQNKPLSSAIRESDSVWLSSNAIRDSSAISHNTSHSTEPRRRVTTPQLSDRTVQERQQLQTFRSRPTYTSSPLDNSTPELLDQNRKHRCRKMCVILTYLLIIWVFIVCAFLLVSTGGEPYYSQLIGVLKQRQKSEVSEDVLIFQYIAFDRLQKEFPSQTTRLWRIIEAATLPIIREDNPSHPAVILLVTGKGSESVAECLAERYAALVTESLKAASHATFNCESYADSDPDDAKRQLDSVLSGAFDAGSKSGVVLQVEKLPGQAPMIFYRFADNDNAPYKDVAIVLTLTLESTDTGSEKDNVAYNELRKVWGSSLDVDKVEPLLSRIGNSVAFVRPETRHTLSENGCQTRRQ